MRMYSVTFENVAITALQDLISIQPADDVPVEIHGAYITQGSDMGDAEAEGIRVEIVRGNTTTGSGGSAATPRALDPNVGAASSTVRINDTTEASAGTEHQLHAEQFNNQIGFHYTPTPEMRPRSNQGAGFLTLRLLGAPADSLSVSGTIYFAEG